jgi:tetratricopeptide (TPR) repeat protein
MKGNATNHGQCLTDETLTDYLEGVLDPVVKTASEVHLVSCDDCRVRLAFYMRLMPEDLQAEEAVALSAVQEEWTRAQNDRRLPNRRRRDFRRWKIASGGVAAALLLALGTRAVLVNWGDPQSADEVIQLLLAENRPFEARISGQPHRPFTTTRGPGETGVAYGLLAGQMTRLAATPHEMAQFYLLQKDFASAIGLLEVIERESGSMAEIHNDLGVAYMESKVPGNLQRASVEFRHALAANPRFAPASFNLAVLLERIGNREQAVAQWSEYLKVESDSKWKQEAAAKAEGIKN